LDRQGVHALSNRGLEHKSMSDKIASFDDLKCWKAARELRNFVALEIVRALPREERFRLGDQLLRSARSVTANIAEGYGRFHYLDNSKFCSIARGSCYETLDHLITARDEGLISEESLQKGRVLFEDTKRLLNGYMRYLKRTASNSLTPNP
jgi:four helix bundle protein